MPEPFLISHQDLKYGIKLRDEAVPLQPGEFRDVDAPGGNLRDALCHYP